MYLYHYLKLNILTNIAINLLLYCFQTSICTVYELKNLIKMHCIASPANYTGQHLVPLVTKGQVGIWTCRRTMME